MAEEIKQFTNTTFTQADLSVDGSTIPIFTNDASTTRVVREVQVQDSDIGSSDATFAIDGTVVGDTFADCSGNVVVPPSESFDIKLSPAVAAATKQSLTLRHVDWVSSTELNFTPITGLETLGTSDSRFPYDFSGVSLNTSVTVGTTEDYIGPLTGGTPTNSNLERYGVIQIPDENLFYTFRVDDNAQSSFQKLTYTGDGSAGSAEGTATAINSGNYTGPCFDYKNNKAFLKQSGTIYEWDLTRSGGHTDNTTATQHTGFYTTNSSYGTGAICNNHYFYFHSATVYVRNLAVSTGYGSFGGGSSSSRPRVVALYNEDEDRFYVISGSTLRNGGYLQYFDASVTTSTSSNYSITRTTVSTALNNYMISITGGSNYNHNLWEIEPVDVNLICIPYSANEARLYKAENGGLTYTGTSMTITGGFNTTTEYKAVLPIGSLNETNTNLSYSDYDIATKVRTQGVEIT
jgi:hypothetical protein